MSLNDSLSKATAERLAAIDEADLAALVKSLSLGFKPSELRAGIERVARGDEVPLPSTLGSPKPITINAWSFVSDHGQYADTYGLTDAKAGELKGLLRDRTDEGIAQITEIVTAQLRKRGSTKPVVVTKQGIPGAGPTDHKPGPGRQGGADLTAVIRQNPTLYGMYKFTPEDTGRQGPQRFRVRLGGGLYATFPSKKGATDVARICRVHGRDHDAIAGRVAFWREGKSPLYGTDIPESVDFDGRLKPDEALPADPVSRAKTEAGGPSSA